MRRAILATVTSCLVPFAGAALAVETAAPYAGMIDDGQQTGTLYAGLGSAIVTPTMTQFVIHLDSGLEVGYSMRLPRQVDAEAGRAGAVTVHYTGWIEIFQPDMSEAHLSILKIEGENKAGEVLVGRELFYQSFYFQNGLVIEPRMPSPLQSAPPGDSPTPDARSCKGGVCTCGCVTGGGDDTENAGGRTAYACCPEGKTPHCNCTAPACEGGCTVDADATRTPRP